MIWLSIGALLLALALTLLTLASAGRARRLARDVRCADIRLRRVAGRVRLAEQVAAGQRMKEDVTEASLTAAQVSTTAAVGVARLVNSVVKGMAARKSDSDEGDRR